MTTLNPRPYANSIDHLRDEIEFWVTARCHHLAAKKELAEAEVPPTCNISVVGRGEATATEELRRRIAQLVLRRKRPSLSRHGVTSSRHSRLI